MPSEYPGLEIMLRKLIQEDLQPMAQRWRKQLPGDVLFSLFLMHHGPGGGFAYASNADRAGAIRSLIEFIAREGKVQWPEFEAFFDMLYMCTRAPEDEDYDPDYIQRVKDIQPRSGG